MHDGSWLRRMAGGGGGEGAGGGGGGGGAEGEEERPWILNADQVRSLWRVTFFFVFVLFLFGCCLGFCFFVYTFFLLFVCFCHVIFFSVVQRGGRMC